MRRELIARSGINEVRGSVVSHFGNRADLIKLAGILADLDAERRRIRPGLRGGPAEALADVGKITGRLRATEHGFRELDALHLHYKLRADRRQGRGTAELNARQAEEFLRVTGEHGLSCAARLGCQPSATVEELLEVAASRLRYWRDAAIDESPTRPVPELLRVELATGDVVKRLEAPGGTWIAASAGGVVLSTAANDFTVYDPDLNVVKQWHAVGDAGIVHVEATNRCAWVLVAESPKHIYPRGSQGYSFQAKVIRVRFDNGATKNFSLGSDTYWTSPIHYRGMQLMPVAGASGDAVAALRCEWVTPFTYIQKTKVLHLMSEGSNHVQSVKVGTYSGGAVSPQTSARCCASRTSTCWHRGSAIPLTSRRRRRAPRLSRRSPSRRRCSR